MKPLIHCIYASTSTAEFREPEIPQLLERARAKNDRLSITGVLLYVQGSFFQVLEGTASEVDEVYAAISQDPRHDRVTQIIREPIATRAFADWSMGFCTLTLRDTARLIGENDVFQDPQSLTQIGSGRAKKLLAAFMRGSWRTEHTGMFETPGRST